MDGLDLIDRKILFELDKNSKISYSKLGKKIRVAKETVKYRIEKLQKEDIIRGFYTVVNFSKLGYTLNRLYLRLQNASPSMEKKIINYLVESNQVVVLYRTDGEYHLVIGVWSRSIWEFENFWGVFKEKFGQYFSKYHSSVMTEYFEFSRLYFIQTSEDKAQFATIRKADVEKLDELDFKLLGLLSNNARASLVEVAKKLKISIVTARYRLRSLMDKKVILGFRPILNLRKLGQEYYKVDLWFRKFDHVNEISQVILSHPNVICTERTIITSDLEFDVEIGNFGKFIDMMDSFKAKFPDDIKEYTYYSRIDNLKTNYMPSFLSIGEK